MTIEGKMRRSDAKHYAIKAFVSCYFGIPIVETAMSLPWRLE